MRMEAAELRDCGRLKDIRAFIDDLYGHDLHAKRVDSLAAATLGVMTGASLAVAMIGHATRQRWRSTWSPAMAGRCRCCGCRCGKTS